MIQVTVTQVFFWLGAVYIAGFFSCLLAVFVAVRMDLKKSIDDKKDRLHERCTTGGQIIGLNGHLPVGKAGRK